MLLVTAGSGSMRSQLFSHAGSRGARAGTVTDDGMVRIIKDGEVIAELPAMPLSEAARSIIAAGAAGGPR